MTITAKDKIILFKKLKESFLTFLYVFLLSLTTFHLHPIDFADSSQFITQQSGETSRHIFTFEDCPIINFSNTGFNSFGISTFSLLIVSNSNPNIIAYFVKFIPNNFSDIRYLRGPPSRSFV